MERKVQERIAAQLNIEKSRARKVRKQLKILKSNLEEIHARVGAKEYDLDLVDIWMRLKMSIMHLEEIIG